MREKTKIRPSWNLNAAQWVESFFCHRCYYCHKRIKRHVKHVILTRTLFEDGIYTERYCDPHCARQQIEKEFQEDQRRAELNKIIFGGGK